MQVAQVGADDRWAAAAGAAWTASAAVLTPVSTIRLGRSAALAPAMSVSRRSPTTSGSSKCAACQRISHQARAPACRPPAARRRWRLAVRRPSTPFPGSSPRSVGSVRSTLAATHSAPARIASAASARIRPAGRGRMALHHGDRLVGELPHRPQTDRAHLARPARRCRRRAPWPRRAVVRRAGVPRSGRWSPRRRRGR